MANKKAPTKKKPSRKDLKETAPRDSSPASKAIIHAIEAFEKVFPYPEHGVLTEAGKQYLSYSPSVKKQHAKVINNLKSALKNTAEMGAKTKVFE